MSDQDSHAYPGVAPLKPGRVRRRGRRDRHSHAYPGVAPLKHDSQLLRDDALRIPTPIQAWPH